MVPQIDLLKRLVLSKFPITIIQSEDCDGVVELFKQLGEYEKRGFFYWRPDIGIHLLSNPDAPLADTQSLPDALRCIEHSRHFGHFLLSGDIRQIFHQTQYTQTMERILTASGKSFRKVFIIGKQPNIPHQLKSKIIVIRLSTQYSGQVT